MKKDVKNITITIPTFLNEKVTKYKEKTGISKNRIYANALISFFEKNKI